MDVIDILTVALGAGGTALIAALAVLISRWRVKKENHPAASSSPKLDIDPQDLAYFDASAIDFIEIRTWNSSQPLRQSSIGETVEVPDKPQQEWVNQKELDQVTNAIEARSYYPACSMVAFDSNSASKFELKVVRDSYANYVAISQYLKAADRLAQVRDYVQHHSIEHIIAHSPLSVIAINVTVLAEGSVLIMRRSNAVSTFRGYWQAGPHKSLGYRSDGHPENFLDLARRALREEAGLAPDDYNKDIVFSWFGMYLPEAIPYMFAHVSTTLTKREVERKVLAASAAYEIADGGERVDWLPLTIDSIEAVTDTWRTDVSGQPDSTGRRYLPHAVIGLRQLVRIMSLVNRWSCQG